MSFAEIVRWLEFVVWEWSPIQDGLSIIVLALLGTGLFLTFRLAFIQVRHLGHGFAVTSGKYDDPDEPGDIPHFQALTTALSATVGIGNIAGVAIAIHWGGPGALFWMWVVGFLGMAVKYTEVTLAQHYREVVPIDDVDAAWKGSVSGGPMYYMERGLGKRWKPLALFFAGALMTTALLTGNAVQANTVAAAFQSEFGSPVWLAGLLTATLVGLVIIGGITRIGKVTAVLAPAMALIYVLGALLIIFYNIADVPAAFALILSEAFNPTAGVAGAGAGVFLMTLMHGVRRGLFSNEAGMGSAPIAHAAAKTDEPVSEGSVALLEPFIDTLVICTMTGLVIVLTGVWDTRTAEGRFHTQIDLAAAEISYIAPDEDGVYRAAPRPAAIIVEGGVPVYAPGDVRLAWQNAPVEQFWVDAQRQVPFSGRILPPANRAVDRAGTEHRILFGDAPRTGAVLTMAGFERGLGAFGLDGLGRFIVIASVLLFAISTSIGWSYYGDRCAYYLFGARGILPYKAVFVVMHFVGAVVALETIWIIGDIALGLVTFPNLVALVLLSGVVVRLTNSYFERRPWKENAEVHARVRAERRATREARRAGRHR